MTSKLGRRDFLAGSAALAAAPASGFTCVEFAAAAPIEVPVVDKLSIRVLVDSTHNLFLRPSTVNGVSVQPTPISAGFPNVIHTQWGLSLWLKSQRGNEPRTLLLDYGYTPDVLINNMGIMGVDVKKIDALIVSHGHFDHYGGLMGFLEKYRSALPADVKLYAGGEDNFCHRLIGSPGQLTDFGTHCRWNDGRSCRPSLYEHRPTSAQSPLAPQSRTAREISARRRLCRTPF